MMNLHFHLEMLITFFLVLTRVTGVVMLVPVFSTTAMPIRLRALLALTMALLVAPLQQSEPGLYELTLPRLAPVFAGEMLMGLMLGIGVRLVFIGVQLTGVIIGQMSGMQLAEIFDPASDASIPVYSQLMDMFMIAVFLMIGGHRHVMRALLDSFHRLPVGNNVMRGDAVDDLSKIFGVSFQLGIQVAAPTIIALLTATLILGFISRTLPQLNAIQIGFNINSMIVFVALLVSIGAAATLFEGRLENILDWFSDSPFEPASSNEVSNPSADLEVSSDESLGQPGRTSQPLISTR